MSGASVWVVPDDHPAVHLLKTHVGSKRTSRASCKGAFERTPPRPPPTDGTPESTLAGRAVAAAASVFGVTTLAVMGGARHAHHVKARWSAAAVLRDAGWSYPAIGGALRVHHTTVLAALDRLPSRVARDAALAQAVAATFTVVGRSLPDEYRVDRVAAK